MNARNFIIVLLLMVMCCNIEVCASSMSPTYFSSQIESGTFYDDLLWMPGNAQYDENGYCIGGTAVSTLVFDGAEDGNYGLALYVFEISGCPIYLDESTAACPDIRLNYKGTVKVNTTNFWYVYENGEIVHSDQSYTENEYTSSEWTYVDLDSSGCMDRVNESNIPMFLLTTGINSNLNEDEAAVDYRESADYTGAKNADAIEEDKNGKQHDETIPLPHNLRVIQGVDQTGTTQQTKLLSNFNKDIVIAWDQEDKLDGMTYDVEVAFSVWRVGNESDGNVEMDETVSMYQNVFKDISYGTSSSGTVQMDANTLNEMKERGYLSKCYVRVKNAVGAKCSNYATICIDIQDKTAIGFEESASSIMPDNEDKVNSSIVDSEEYTGNDVNAESGSASSDVSVGNVMSFVQDGFGLLGNNGVISLMSKTFLYLPNSIWTMIKFFVSMMIIISIVGLIKKVI